MRFSYFITLTLTLAIAATYWYQSTSYICPVPVAYRIGDIDQSFDLGQAEVLLAIDQATAIWEQQLGEDLFVFDEQADLAVSFVFDDRQARSDAQANDEARLNTIATENDRIRDTLDQLVVRYDGMQQSFLDRNATYEAQLSQHNEAVRQINDRGGVDGDAYASLETTQAELSREAAALRTLQTQLRDLGSQINQLSVEGNRLITSYNDDVAAFNDAYNTNEIFSSGHYTGDQITIYTFANEAELVSILAHEFGHALGIGHVDTPGALMYYLLEEDVAQPMDLTDADIAAYAATCQFDSWDFKLRQFIRSLLP